MRHAAAPTAQPIDRYGAAPRHEPAIFSATDRHLWDAARPLALVSLDSRVQLRRMALRALGEMRPGGPSHIRTQRVTTAPGARVVRDDEAGEQALREPTLIVGASHG